jgi:hypothetical protein
LFPLFSAMSEVFAGEMAGNMADAMGGIPSGPAKGSTSPQAGRAWTSPRTNSGFQAAARGQNIGGYQTHPEIFQNPYGD